MKIGNQGTFTLYEACFFFVLLMLASSIISAYYLYPKSVGNTRGDFGAYCENSRRAFLEATVPETYYVYRGENVFRKDLSVKELIVEFIYLEEGGIERDNITYGRDIIALGRKHFDDFWLLRAVSDSGTEIRLSNRGVSGGGSSIRSSSDREYSSSSWDETGMDGGTIEITLFLLKV